MNTTFAQAVKETLVEAETTNGMKTYASSLNALVDLFFLIGASRGKDITAVFEKAYQEDRQLALRILAWSRDVRGGAGERGIYRSLLQFIEKFHIEDLPMMVSLTPEYGRWDDLLSLTSNVGKQLAFTQIKDALLIKQDGLCAKWMPRKGAIANELRAFMGLTPKGYRKTLVTLTKVVETQMCSGEWDKIQYGHVPSVAAARYQKAFSRHDSEGYGKYITGLKAGTEKINAGSVYPYDVIKSIRSGNQDVAAAQWEALPNFIGDALVLPLVDVSGSMGCPVGGNANLRCIDVAVSLGLYLADKNTGPFKDMFMTFTSTAKIEILHGDIIAKYNQLSSADWEMSTNLNAAFAEILRVATTNHISEENMPKYICVMSDMEFDQCINNASNNALAMIKGKYAEAGYTVPNVIFWNLNARAGNVPVRYTENGTALISGFSPAIMKSVLSAEGIDPISIMLNTINSPRYQTIV